MQRKIALNIIYKTINDSSYTNLLMRSELEKLKPIQRGFVTNLVNGVLKNYNYLCFQHEKYYQKTSLRNKVILSMATFERFFLNEKDYVVNNEYANLANNEYDKNFINAIIHKITKLEEPKNMHIKYSLPEWIYKLLLAQYKENELKIILNNYHRIPKVYYHINPNKCNMNDLKNLDIEFISDVVFTSNSNLIATKEFNEGLFYIQDINASKLIDLFNFDENDIFLDACSAPGSKLFNALEYLKPHNCYANDLSEKRVNLIKQRALILGYDGVNYSSIDASRLHECFDIKFDKVLIDVPCSGLGVIGRRSDIKFHIKPESLDELQNIQKNILLSASKVVKDNGYLLYSTCTLNKKENEKQIESFLKENNSFKLIRMRTILNLEGDLFFEALLRKV